MTAVVFLGPSLPAVQAAALAPGARILGPAAHGDVYRATRDGARTIVLIDGLFESVRSVWHKEILHALGEGVRVVGAASMGALRAAECADFGMEAIGRVAADYLSGRRTSDGDVAVAHAGAGDGYAPSSEAQVNVEATLEAAVAHGVLDAATADAVAGASRSVFYAERTWPAVLGRAVASGVLDAGTAAHLGGWLPGNAVDQKADDARLALGTIAGRTFARPAGPAGAPAGAERRWELVRTGFWAEACAAWDAARHGGTDFAALVLDEARLDPDRYRALALDALVDHLSSRLLTQSGSQAEPDDLRAALTVLRHRLGLHRGGDVDEWRVAQGLDTTGFRDVVSTLAARRWAELRSTRDLPVRMAAALRRDGAWRRLADRAAAKAALLDTHGVDDAEAARRAGPDEALLAAWASSARHSVALATLGYEPGHDDPAALLRALRREHAYRALVEAHPPAATDANADAMTR